MNDAETVDEQLQKLERVLEVARRNGNQLFVTNIERDIAALRQGQPSPIIAEYLTDRERERIDGSSQQHVDDQTPQ